MMRAQLKAISDYGDGKLTTSYEIVKVLEIISPPELLPLDWETAKE